MRTKFPQENLLYCPFMLEPFSSRVPGERKLQITLVFEFVNIVGLDSKDPYAIKQAGLRLSV